MSTPAEAVETVEQLRAEVTRLKADLDRIYALPGVARQGERSEVAECVEALIEHHECCVTEAEHAGKALGREEQREACAARFWPPNRPGVTRESAMELVRATPLDSTPLADRIKELEVEFATTRVALARLQDVSALLKAEAERDSFENLANVTQDALNASQTAHAATMRERDRLREAGLLLKAVGVEHWHHNEDCSRNTDCDEAKECGAACDQHEDGDCDLCECGISELRAADVAMHLALATTQAAAALAELPKEKPDEPKIEAPNADGLPWVVLP
jgi:hypothetical protein